VKRARRPAALALCAAAIFALSSCGGSASGVATIPADFLGISDGIVAGSQRAQEQLLRVEFHSGAELLRQTFAWSTIEPRPGVYDWSLYDRDMSLSARAGLRMLPVLAEAPTWAEVPAPRGSHLPASTQFPPRDMSQFAQFAAAVVRRYGPHGTFWRAHPHLPDLPIRSWQVWNEPNFNIYWGYRPSAAAYAAMLRAMYPAIRAVDPHAEVVTAGIAGGSFGIPPTKYLNELLADDPPFTTLGLHPYQHNAAQLIAAVVAVRRTLNRVGRTKTPIWITEFGWASGGPPSSFTVGAKLQARYILQSIVTLAEDASALEIRGVIYYDWQDGNPYAGRTNFWGFHTGLVALDGIEKPALSAYYQAAGVVHSFP
jgi:hypothetical protein